jgi:putative phosphonate metabolism protein
MSPSAHTAAFFRARRPRHLQDRTEKRLSARYALYWCPDPASDLWRWACRWLGRDPVSGAEYQTFDPAMRSLIEAPRRYGFHATLKPPFRIRADKDPASFLAAVEEFATAREPFVAPPLELVEMQGFLALVLSGPSPRMDRLAADCVRSFDVYRELPTDAELAKRRAQGLDPIEEANLRAWGYPYVLDRFRFHLTLTGRPRDPQALKARLQADTAAFCMRPLRVDALAVFRQPEPDAPFQMAARFPFKG